jgi:hypothetical protein
MTMLDFSLTESNGLIGEELAWGPAWSTSRS